MARAARNRPTDLIELGRAQGSPGWFESTNAHVTSQGEPKQLPAQTSEVRPLISRDALIAKLHREQYETAAGYSSDELAHRRGWNARARELIAWLRGEDRAAPAATPLTDEEKAEVFAMEQRQHALEQEQARRESARNRWAFEFDVEQDAISEAYARELGGEGG